MAKPTFNRVWNYISATLQEFANVLSPYIGGGTNLKAGTKELTLDDTGSLILNTGDLTIATDPNNGDDIVINATDRLTLQAGDKLINNENTGGRLQLYAGDGSDGDTITAAGDGGDIRLYAGDAGNTTGGPTAYGGNVFIKGGYTTQTNSEGGSVYIYGGSSVDAVIGSVTIGDYYRNWVFDENNGTLRFPPVTLSVLPTAALGNVGMRAIINDSTVAASTNFGAIAAGTGAFTVPVFSDGTNWLIG
jgi:hypothetical protein